MQRLRMQSLSVALCLLVAAACSDSSSSSSSGSSSGSGANDASVITDGGVSHGDGSSADAPSDSGKPPVVAHAFTASTADFPNPERGFYGQIDLVGETDYSDIRGNGMTLAYAGVRLDAYRTADLPAKLLSDLEAGFARVRAAGFKVILRFAYNDGPIGAADATKARVLGHLTQLAPVLAKNDDVIAVLQAGFIGAWGEGHSSTNGLDAPAVRKDIYAATLNALPATRMIQARTPMQKSAAYGGPMTMAAAFTNTPAARIGHHNDCFLASADDEGTYDAPVKTWMDFVAAEGRFTPVGGETCGTNAPHSACANATAEMAALHWSFLNALYHPDVLAGFTSGGCMGAIRRELGYRFALTSVGLTKAVVPGHDFGVDVSLDNLGYASPFNPRDVVLVLSNAAKSVSAKVTVDPRRWEKGPTHFFASLRVPADMPPGSYTVSLSMPDPAPALAARPEYAIRLANDGIWDAPTGRNALGTIDVDPAAPAFDDPAALILK